MPHLFASAAIGFGALFVSSLAHAEDGASARRPEPAAHVEPSRLAPSTDDWYGWQTFTVDGASVVAVTLGLASDGPGAQRGLLLVGMSTFALGPPLVHALRGRLGLAAGDLGVRLAAMGLGLLVGGAIGASTVAPLPPCEPSTNTECPLFGDLHGLDQTLEGAMIGLAVGALGASLLDGLVLARESPPKEAAARGFSWSPSLSPLPSGLSAGVVGRF